MIQSLEELYQRAADTFHLSSARERRSLLLTEMKDLGDKKIDCSNCVGTCCTFSANSMKVTVLEAIELMLYLRQEKEDMALLKIRLEETVRSYRLDHEISLGKKTSTSLRKTYTCPFYLPGPKGCTLKKEHKPYGCLGFNPRIAGETGGQCASNIVLLEERERAHAELEKKASDYIQQELKLDWEKRDLPRALLSLINIFALAKP